MATLHRLDRVLASLGYGSRREVRDLIAAGRAAQAGAAVLDPALKVDSNAVTIDGQPLDHPNGILVLMNKARGHVCSHDTSEGTTVYDLLPQRWRARNPPVTSVGRLDKDTTGVLLLTDIRNVVHQLTSPKRKVTKVYHALLDKPPSPDAAALFASGTLLLHGESDPCAPAHVRMLGTCEAECVLTEGRYHQVRRMFAAVGATVLALQRVRFGPFEATGLAEGEWRNVDLSTLIESGLYR
jgi:16S rRNA pseudouridine516 synthase